MDRFFYAKQNRMHVCHFDVFLVHFLAFLLSLNNIIIGALAANPRPSSINFWGLSD